MKYLEAKKIKSYFSSHGTVSRWWNPEEGLYSYHYQNQFRALQSYRTPRAGETVLDVGTGRGLFAIWFAIHGCHVQAVDINEEMLHIAKQNAHMRGVAKQIQFSKEDAEDLNQFPTRSFDWVSCISTFDHLPNLDKAIGEMAARLRPKGKFVFNYCPANSLYGFAFRLYARYISRFYRLSEEEGLVARLYYPAEIERLCHKHGIKIKKQWGIGFFCFPLRPEYQMGLLTTIPRWINQIEERFFPFYTIDPLTRWSQLTLCLGVRK